MDRSPVGLPIGGGGGGGGGGSILFEGDSEEISLVDPLHSSSAAASYLNPHIHLQRNGEGATDVYNLDVGEGGSPLGSTHELNPELAQRHMEEKMKEYLEHRATKGFGVKGSNLNYDWNERFQQCVEYKSHVNDDEFLSVVKLAMKGVSKKLDRSSGHAGADSALSSSSFANEEQFKALLNLPLATFRRLPLKLEPKKLEFLKAGIEAMMTKRVEIFKLEREFADKATEMVKTIVRELPLPKHQKTIPIVNAGGVAGGVKFCKDGIFFKLATGNFIYHGSTTAAAKSLANERKGLQAFFDANVLGLHVPMIAQVDFLGFRALAMSLIDVNESTLVYGTQSAGMDAVASNEMMNKLMSLAGTKLNVRGHKVGDVTLHGPWDIEGHHSEDGRFYILDPPRLYPPFPPKEHALLFPQDSPVLHVPFKYTADPEKMSKRLRPLLGPLPKECPQARYVRMEDSRGTFYYVDGLEGIHVKAVNKRATYLLGPTLRGPVVMSFWNEVISMYRVMRPEFVRAFEVPLCSDAFTKHLSDDPDRSMYNGDVMRAAQKLLGTSEPSELPDSIIKEFANDVKRHKVPMIEYSAFIRELHKRGINVRFLGYLRQYFGQSKHKHVRQFLLTEICTRVMKSNVRGVMRDVIRKNARQRKENGLDAQVVDEHGVVFRQVLVRCFNKFLGDSPASTDFWQMEMKPRIQQLFPYALTAEEADSSFDLRDQLMLFPVFKRLQEKTGVHFKLGAQKRLFEHPFLFKTAAPLTEGDIAVVGATTIPGFVFAEQITPMLRKSVEIKEAETYLAVDMVHDAELSLAYNVLVERRYHGQLCRLLGENSPFVIQSYYELAMGYRALGHLKIALDNASRGLSMGQVIYGSFSEETMLGLVTVGQIFGAMGKRSEAIEFYKRALQRVQKLHRLHPLHAKLNLMLCFLFRRKNESLARQYLVESYKAYTALYGATLPKLIVPLMAMTAGEQLGITMTSNVSRAVEAESEKAIFDVTEKFWPDGLLAFVHKAMQSQKEMMMRVLQALGMEEYAETFSKLDFVDEDFFNVEKLTEEFLKEKIGITKMGMRKRLLRTIAAVRQAMDDAETGAEITPNDVGVIVADRVIRSSGVRVSQRSGALLTES